jgi:hypothetical protein
LDVEAVSLARRVLFFFFHNPDHLTPDTLPEFPLRCQHCEAAIRLAAVHPSERVTVSGHDGALFRDASGHIVCDRQHKILHRPMPSVL